VYVDKIVAGAAAIGAMVFGCRVCEDKMVWVLVVGALVRPSMGCIGVFIVTKVGTAEIVPAVVGVNVLEDNTVGAVVVGKDLEGRIITGETVVSETGTVVTGAMIFGFVVFNDKMVGIPVFIVTRVGTTDIVPVVVGKDVLEYRAVGEVVMGKDIGENIIGEIVVSEIGAAVTGGMVSGCIIFDDKVLGIAVVGAFV